MPETKRPTMRPVLELALGLDDGATDGGGNVPVTSRVKVDCTCTVLMVAETRTAVERAL